MLAEGDAVVSLVWELGCNTLYGHSVLQEVLHV